MNLYYISSKENYTKDDGSSVLGDRGCYLNEMATLGLPIAPAVVFDSKDFETANENEIKDNIKKGVQFIEKIVGKVYGDSSNPLLLKAVISPSIKLSVVKSTHNLGLNSNTVGAFAQKVSSEFAYNEYFNLIIEFSKRFSSQKIPVAKIEEAKKLSPESACKEILSQYSESFTMDPYKQLYEVFITLRNSYFSDPLNKDISCALVIQAMVFGNYPDESFSGTISSRNVVTGEDEIYGWYVANEFELNSDKRLEISKIDQKYYRELEKASDKLETKFKEIRKVKFVVEESNFWLIDQFTEENKSTRAGIRMLLDMYKKNIIEYDFVIKNISDGAIASLLHPEIDNESAKKFKYIDVGEMGSPGAAKGKVYFSTPKLLEAYKDAKVKGQDTNMILCMEATYAGDVQAIEIGSGVICSEGGYASHAPVVARSLGKAAIIGQDFNIGEDSLTIGDTIIKEGDYISMNVPSFASPRIYFGETELIIPDPSQNGLSELMEIISAKEKNKKDADITFQIMANADTVEETKAALNFGAEGIGLCRTEHMFFNKDRINLFRLLLINEDENVRTKVLEQLKKIQKKDFYELLDILDGRPLTVRLLDAPMHEFIPTKKEEVEEVKNLLKEYDDKSYNSNLENIFARLKETNPMLGNRGCRFGISFPDVYQMQIAALLEAATDLHLNTNGNKLIKLKIMFPLISTTEELKFLKNGKDIEGTVIPGYKGTEKEVLRKYNLDVFPFESIEVGVMIELPSAALLSGELAKYSSFFSFGTNDLTQTTHGLSRDDINSFYPNYTQYDIMDNNPFLTLSDPVKNLISYATVNGRLTRPDIYTSLCGEQGAEPKDIEFCINNKLNSVSCSPFKIPLARLAAAKFFIDK